MTRRPAPLTFALWLIPLAFLAFFFYQPLIAIFRVVFSERFSQGWALFEWSQVSKPLRFSFLQAILSTLLTLAVGLPAAWLFARFDFPGRQTLRAVSLLPFILPTVVVAAAFNTLIGPQGWINQALMAAFGLSAPPLKLLNSLFAILLAHVFYNTSIIIRIVGAAWSRLNPRLEHAARLLGAKPWQAFTKVTLPLLMPSLLSASLLVFLFDFTSFGVVLMLGGPRFSTIEVEIYNQAMNRFNLPVAGLLSLIQLGITLLVTLLQNRVNTPRYGKAALNPERSALIRPAKLWQKAFVVLMVVCLIGLFAVPIFSLITRSFVTLEADRGQRGEAALGFTLRYHRELFHNRSGSIFYVPPIQAIRNSLAYSGAAILIAGSLGTLSAYAMARHARLNRLLEPLFMLPLGASAVTLGLGFLLVFNRAPWVNSSFPIMVPIAHSLIALPFVVRTMLPAVRGIPVSLREASRSLGANLLQVLLRVDLPILLRSLLVSLVFVFTISLGEFGASSFLSNPHAPTIPVAIYRYISQPGALNYGQALAMSSLLLLVCGLGSLLIEKIRLPGEELF